MSFSRRNSKNSIEEETVHIKENDYRLEDTPVDLPLEPQTTGSRNSSQQLEESTQEDTYDLANDSYMEGSDNYTYVSPNDKRRVTTNAKPRHIPPKPAKKTKQPSGDDASYYNHAGVNDTEIEFTRNSLYESG